MPNTVKTVSSPEFSAIAAILESDPLSCEIVRFLLDNESAMDSAKGIAAWGVHNDQLAVRPSLHRLFACGAVQAHPLSSGTTVYGLTQNPEVRAWLRSAFGNSVTAGRTLKGRQDGEN